MDSALIASTALLGIASTPHCAAMCGAPCAAVVAGREPAAALSFHIARTASYAAGGAVVASSVGALAELSQAVPALRTLWTLLHALAFALGVWLLVQGRQPAWMARVGQVPKLATVVASPVGSRGSAPAAAGALRAAAAGSLWVAWPCGMLQSALAVSAMTSSGVAGAAAMAAFALASSAGLIAAPWLWQRWVSGARSGQRERMATRAAGLLLMAASGWALGHGVWMQVAAYCFGP